MTSRGHWNPPKVLLIGGLSRSGKSTLSAVVSESLRVQGIESLIFPLDNWIVSKKQRSPYDKVTDRFRIDHAVSALRTVLSGDSVTFRAYNPTTRCECNGLTTLATGDNTQLVIVEGVVALADQRLRNLADYSIFITVNSRLRIRRMIELYRDVKCLDAGEYRRIIRLREIEEVPTINESKVYANLVACASDIDRVMRNVSLLFSYPDKSHE